MLFRGTKQEQGRGQHQSKMMSQGFIVVQKLFSGYTVK
jgi:hypothetical protein